MSSSTGKVLIMGWDGATADLVGPMMAAGELPNLKRIFGGAAPMPMETTVPPMTLPAWITCTTGVNPGKLGIFHFFRDLHVYSPSPLVSSADVRVPFLWDLVGQAGKQSLVVNIPRMYPAMKVDGAMVSILEGSHRVSTYPESIWQELGHQQSVVDMLKMGRRFRNLFSLRRMDLVRSELEFFTEMWQTFTRVQADTCVHLMRTRPWDMLMSVFGVTDVISHKFWRFMDPQHPAYDPQLAPLFGDVVRRAYRWCDEALGRLVEAAGENVTVVVLSDHGFHTLHHFFMMNDWLEQKGYLKRRAAPAHWAMRKIPVWAILRKAGLGLLSRLLPPALRNLQIPLPKRYPPAFHEQVDWAATRAYYAPFSYGVNVNLAGREAQGSVPPAEFEAVRDAIAADLLTVKSPSGKPMIAECLRKEQVYQGPHTARGVDLFPVFADSSCMPQGEFGPGGGTLFRQVSATDKIGAGHYSSRHGICLVRGPISNSATAPASRSLHIQDIVPLALYHLGIDVPAHIDGRVPEWLINPAHLAKHPPRTAAATDDTRAAADHEQRLSEDELRGVVEQMRNLGYME